MRFFLFFFIFCALSSGAFAREAKEQRARRDVAARLLLLALDDRDAAGIDAAVKALSENLEPAGVPVFAPLKMRLEALADDLRRARNAVADARLRAAIGETTSVFGVDTAPPLTPDLKLAQSVYAENCRACHGDNGAGDGQLASKVRGGVPSFVAGPSASKSPFAFYQKIAAGKVGTPMPGYERKLDPLNIWSLAYLAASFDLQPPPKDPDLQALLKRGLSHDRLSRSDDAELAAWAGDATLLPYLRTRAPFASTVPRSAPR